MKTATSVKETEIMLLPSNTHLFLAVRAEAATTTPVIIITPVPTSLHSRQSPGAKGTALNKSAGNVDSAWSTSFVSVLPYCLFLLVCPSWLQDITNILQFYLFIYTITINI